MKTSFIAVTCLLLFLPAACYPVRYDGPYEGKVVDAATGQPIEGVVVLGTWSRETLTAGGAVHRFYDAMETVTDNNGEFEIKGLGLLVVSNVLPMDVLIFKAGYEHIGTGPWDSFKEDEILRNKIKWKGNRAIIPLKKLTIEERKKQGSPDFPSESPKDKIELILEEINKDRIERGLKPLGIER